MLYNKIHQRFLGLGKNALGRVKKTAQSKVNSSALSKQPCILRTRALFTLGPDCEVAGAGVGGSWDLRLVTLL